MAVLKFIAILVIGWLFIAVPYIGWVFVMRGMRSSDKRLQSIFYWANAVSKFVLTVYVLVAFLQDFNKLRSGEPVVFYLVIGCGLYLVVYFIARLRVEPTPDRPLRRSVESEFFGDED